MRSKRRAAAFPIFQFRKRTRLWWFQVGIFSGWNINAMQTRENIIPFMMHLCEITRLL
mgnify:CR=1 FL=1